MIREHGSGSKMIKAAKSSAPAIKEKSDPEPETPAPGTTVPVYMRIYTTGPARISHTSAV